MARANWMIPSLQNLLLANSSRLKCGFCRANSNTAAISRVRRSKFPRLYPTTIVNPDGSSYTIRYHEPRQIIYLPLDFDTLSEEEQVKVMSMRKPKKKSEEVLDMLDGDTFTADNYLNTFKHK